MNTKFQIVSVAVGLLGAATIGHGGIPVSIVASAPDARQWMVEGERWDETTKQWTKEINKLNEQIQEVKNVYEQAQVISAFVGDPKAALQDLNQIQASAETFRRSAVRGRASAHP
jgi:Spy/CpxP family protein refolding chaperone